VYWYIVTVNRRWLVPFIFAVSALLGWNGLMPDLAKPVPPVALPVIAATDGLPDVLIAGETYQATFQASFPEDWPIEQRSGQDRSARALLIAYVNRGHLNGLPKAPEKSGWLIMDSIGEMHAAGATVTLTATLLAPSPGPLTVRLQASEPGGLLGEQGIRSATRDFQHTIVAAPASAT
jgi:hypothetical protein